MGESNNSFFENVLSKNIDEDIPINADLPDKPEKKLCIHNENIDYLDNRKVYR